MMDTGFDSHTKIIPRRASGYEPAWRAAERRGNRYAAALRGWRALLNRRRLLKGDQALYTDRLLPTATKQ